jgi:hypothetical protein
MPTSQRPRRRFWIRILYLLILIWFVQFLLPEIGDHADPLIFRTDIRLRMHYRAVQEGRETFADPDSRSLQRFDKTSRLSLNGYRLRILKSPAGSPEAVLAYPIKFKVHGRSWGDRLLRLGFKMHAYPSYLLTREGVLCGNYTSGYCDAYPPTGELPKPGEKGWHVYSKMQDGRWIWPTTATSSAPAR